MNFLFTADLHLSDNQLEGYRWLVFPYLRKVVKQRSISDLFILGDLTNQKDNHSGRFVSRMVFELIRLSKLTIVHILKGNHDYTDPESPFFGFTGELGEGRIRYYSDPTTVTCGGKEFLMLPHTRTPKEDWTEIPHSGLDYVLVHQCIKGAESENGAVMDGVSPSMFESFDKGTKIFAGDIHVPHKVGRVEYIGAPHPIHFGDSYKPRIVVDGDDKRIDLYPSSIRRMKVKVSSPEKLSDLKADSGDHLRVVLSITRAQFHEWGELTKRVTEICEKRGFVLFGVELQERKRVLLNSAEAPKEIEVRKPGEVFDLFCDGRGDIDEYTKSVGQELIK